MYCPKCGKELDDEKDKYYCSGCGTKVNDDSFYDEAHEKNEKQKQNETALASMIAGIVSIVIPLIGIPLAFVALSLAKKCPKSEYARIGKIAAIIGITLSAIMIFAMIIYIAFFEAIVRRYGINMGF